MEIFYFGSVVDNEGFNENVQKSRRKPSSSAQVFESALLKGLYKQRQVSITAVSAESIAIFPYGHKLFIRQRNAKIDDSLETIVLGGINLPFIKNLCRKLSLRRLLKKWLVKTKSEPNRIVIVYGLYPIACRTVLKLTKKFECKNCAVITDVPSMTAKYNKPRSILRKISLKFLLHNCQKVQNKFDSYVYLTEHMSRIIAPKKPFLVMETIIDDSVFNDGYRCFKSSPPAIMYAGTLFKEYGIDLIVESFLQLKGNYELWIFGSGDYENDLKKICLNDSRIRFFGRRTREEVLKKEKEASLLINLRNPRDEYTKYSFPSKLVEYMMSGTPVLTTKLDGIPNEYFDYVFETEAKVSEIIQNIEALFKRADLVEFGEKARMFVKKNKNNCSQAKRIVDFVENIVLK